MDLNWQIPLSGATQKNLNIAIKKFKNGQFRQIDYFAKV